MTSRQRLERAFQAHAITDEARLASYLRGCNLSQPVVLKKLGPQDRFQVWVRDDGEPGIFGAPIEENPSRLGIIIERRHREVYGPLHSLDVIECSAADFPTGLVDRVGGEGGGTQYILPPNWLTSVERIL